MNRLPEVLIGSSGGILLVAVLVGVVHNVQSQSAPEWVAPYLEQRALERAAVPPFESGIRSPYGDFTDNDGQRQTTEDVLWECYYQTRKFSQEWPDVTADGLALIYDTCILESGATI